MKNNTLIRPFTFIIKQAHSLNPRRRRLLKKVIRGLRPDRNSLRFLSNHIRWMAFNREKRVCVPKPTNLMLELSARCNLHCVMCAREFKYGKEMDQGFMPLDRAKEIVGQLYPYLTSIGLTGLGETFLYPHLEEICRYIKEKRENIIITMSTNAHFKGFMEKLERCVQFIDNLQISLDGVGKVYERIRPDTDFDFIRSNITAAASLCKKNNVELKLNFVITPWNYTDMKNVIDFAAGLDGIGSIEFNPMNIASNPDVGRDFYSFYESDAYQNACSSAIEYAKNIGEGKRMEISMLHFNKPNFHQCPYPWEHFYITWNGYLVPCCGKPFPKLLNFGNAFDAENIMDIINSDKSRQFRSQWQQGNAPAFCSNCQFVDF